MKLVPAWVPASFRPRLEHLGQRSNLTVGAARLVLMSDGFARLFQEYGLMSAEDGHERISMRGAETGGVSGLDGAVRVIFLPLGGGV